jgi:hypothetical protein
MLRDLFVAKNTIVRFPKLAASIGTWWHSSLWGFHVTSLMQSRPLTETPECIPDIHEGPPNLAESNVLDDWQLPSVADDDLIHRKRCRGCQKLYYTFFTFWWEMKADNSLMRRGRPREAYTQGPRAAGPALALDANQNVSNSTVTICNTVIDHSRISLRKITNGENKIVNIGGSFSKKRTIPQG